MLFSRLVFLITFVIYLEVFAYDHQYIESKSKDVVAFFPGI